MTPVFIAIPATVDLPDGRTLLIPPDSTLREQRPNDVDALESARLDAVAARATNGYACRQRDEAVAILRDYPTGQDDGTWIARREALINASTDAASAYADAFARAEDTEHEAQRQHRLAEGFRRDYARANQTIERLRALLDDAPCTCTCVDGIGNTYHDPGNPACFRSRADKA